MIYIYKGVQFNFLYSTRKQVWVANSTPQYLQVAFTNIYGSVKYSSSGKYWHFLIFWALNNVGILKLS